MPKTFTEHPCSHCGDTIKSPESMETLGDNDVHSRCLSEYVDTTPKIEITPYSCGGCKRSFYTEEGIERHLEREVCP